MEIKAEKIKLMTNNASSINKEIKINGQKLETVTSFKYLGSVVSDEGSKPQTKELMKVYTWRLTISLLVFSAVNLPVYFILVFSMVWHLSVCSMLVFECFHLPVCSMLMLYLPVLYMCVSFIFCVVFHLPVCSILMF